MPAGSVIDIEFHGDVDSIYEISLAQVCESHRFGQRTVHHSSSSRVELDTGRLQNQVEFKSFHGEDNIDCETSLFFGGTFGAEFAKPQFNRGRARAFNIPLAIADIQAGHKIILTPEDCTSKTVKDKHNQSISVPSNCEFAEIKHANQKNLFISIEIQMGYRTSNFFPIAGERMSLREQSQLSSE